jgi:vancomycin permeability regulator SanA
MAQDFTRYSAEATNSATTIFTANSNDAVIGVRVTNTTAAAIAIDVWVSVTGSTDRYIAKDLSIPPASSVELVTGGAKFVMQNTDVLKVQSVILQHQQMYM